MNYQTLMKDIKENRIAPVYLLYGEEYRISKMMAEQLKNQLIEPAVEALNYISFDEKKHSFSDIISFSETMPFMSNRRMVLVADTNLLNIAIPDKDVDGLIDYLKKPNALTCLVFVARKIDQKRKLTKALIKHAAVMTADRLTRDPLEKWIAKRLRMGGKTIDRSTMSALVEGLEYLEKDSKMNLDDVDNEVEKVMAYTGVRSQILPQDVALVLSRGMEQSIFRMLDHLGSGNLKESLEILDYLFESGEPAGRVLYMMVRQLRIVYRAKLMKSKGSSAEQIATTIGLKPFMINNALRQGRNFSMEKLQRAYERCATVDEMLKSTKNEPKILLEMLIFDLR